MSKLKFSDFYNQEDSIEENFLTALGGKISTGAMNVFRKTTKHISVAPDFLRIFKELPLPKYDKTLDKLAGDFNKQIKWKNVFIKDIRVGDIAGRGNVISMLTKRNAKIPPANDPLWKDKEHSPSVNVYVLSNGGVLSLWNLPTTDNDPTDHFDAKKRVYAIGMNSTAEKAFMLMFGMGFKDWLTKQQFADNTETEKTAAEKTKENLTVAGFEISDDVYKKLTPAIIPESVIYVTELATVDTPVDTPVVAPVVAPPAPAAPPAGAPPVTSAGPLPPVAKQPAGALSQILTSKLKAKVSPLDQEGKKGFIYDLGQQGRLYVYKNKDGKSKIAYTKGLEDTLVANKIIAKPLDLPNL